MKNSLLLPLIFVIAFAGSLCAAAYAQAIYSVSQNIYAGDATRISFFSYLKRAYTTVAPLTAVLSLFFVHLYLSRHASIIRLDAIMIILFSCFIWGCFFPFFFSTRDAVLESAKNPQKREYSSPGYIHSAAQKKYIIVPSRADVSPNAVILDAAENPALIVADESEFKAILGEQALENAIVSERFEEPVLLRKIAALIEQFTARLETVYSDETPYRAVFAAAFALCIASLWPLTKLMRWRLLNALLLAVAYALIIASAAKLDVWANSVSVLFPAKVSRYVPCVCYAAVAAICDLAGLAGFIIRRQDKKDA